MDLKRYALTVIVTSFAMFVVNYTIVTFAKIDIANAGMGLIPVLLASMLEGQRYARSHGQVPESPAMWQFAKQAALIVSAFNMIMVVALSLVLADLRVLMAEPVWAAVLFAAILIIGLITFFVTRQFVAMGAKSGLKAAAKARKTP